MYNVSILSIIFDKTTLNEIVTFVHDKYRRLTIMTIFMIFFTKLALPFE